MKTRSLRSLAVSVATGRVAAVFLEGKELIGWCRSAQAFNDPKRTNEILSHWIKGFAPDRTLVEDAASAARKGPQSRLITETVAATFSKANCLDLRVRRRQSHDNKYQEAVALAERFPAAKSILPLRPPIWLPEPRNMSYFEALSLFVAVTGK